MLAKTVQSLEICGKQKMSAMGQGCSVTISSTPTVLQWQNCMGRMSCFLLEERLSRQGQYIEDDDGCQDFQLGCTSFRDMMMHFDVGTWRRTDIPSYLVLYACGTGSLHYRRNMIVFPLLYDQLCGCIKDWLQRTQMCSSSMEENDIFNSRCNWWRMRWLMS